MQHPPPPPPPSPGCQKGNQVRICMSDARSVWLVGARMRNPPCMFMTTAHHRFDNTVFVNANRLSYLSSPQAVKYMMDNSLHCLIVQATGFVPEQHCLQLLASIARCLMHESICRERMLPEHFQFLLLCPCSAYVLLPAAIWSSLFLLACLLSAWHSIKTYNRTQCMLCWVTEVCSSEQTARCS